MLPLNHESVLVVVGGIALSNLINLPRVALVMYLDNLTRQSHDHARNLNLLAIAECRNIVLSLYGIIKSWSKNYLQHAS